MDSKNPTISAVICTRNRGDRVIQAVESVLGNSHPNYELILVDQSTNEETCNAIQGFLNDPRFRYVRSDTVGTGRSRNIGLQNARARIVAYTDDDCTVSVNWLAKMEEAIHADPRITVAFCQVIAGPHDREKGYITALEFRQSAILRTPRDFHHDLGLGAGMAVRLEAVLKMGGFDNHFGPGSFFRSGEDWDIAIRAILKGGWVSFTADTYVIHHGFRSFQDGKKHTARDAYASGAAYIKPVKCGHWSALIAVPTHVWRSWVDPYLSLLRLKRSHGYLRFYHFLKGCVAGLLTPTDRKDILYLRGKESNDAAYQ